MNIAVNKPWIYREMILIVHVCLTENFGTQSYNCSYNWCVFWSRNQGFDQSCGRRECQFFSCRPQQLNNSNHQLDQGSAACRSKSRVRLVLRGAVPGHGIEACLLVSLNSFKKSEICNHKQQLSSSLHLPACFRVKYLLQPSSGLRPVPPRRFSCQSLCHNIHNHLADIPD